MLTRTLSLIRKELIQVFRDPMTLRLTLIAPLLQLIIFGYVVNIDVDNVPSAVIDYDKSAASRELIQSFESSGYFTFSTRLERPDEADLLLDKGEIDMALIIPRDFQRDLRTGSQAELLAMFNGSDSNTATTAGNYAAGIVAQFGQNVILRELGSLPNQISLPIEARTRLLFNPSAESSTYILPGIIAVLLAMLLIMLSAISIVREKERGTLEQLSVTPLGGLELVIGKSVPFLLMGMVITCLLTPVAILWFGIPFLGSFLLLLASSILYMFACLGFGILIGISSDTQQQALMLSFFVILPQILLSGFIFPIDSMPAAMQWFTWLIPARYFLVCIRSIFLKGLPMDYFAFELGALATMALIIYGISAFRFQKSMGA